MLAEREERRPVHLLFTTQGFEKEAMIRIIQRFIAQCQKTGLQYRITIKMHPSYDRDKQIYAEPFGSDPHVQVLMGEESPNTMQLLSGADYHVSIHSACHYDAIGIGVPTVVLKLKDHDLVENLYKNEVAVLAGSGEELFSIIENNIKGRLTEKEIEYYCTQGISKNIEMLLQDIGIRSGIDP